jgi:hypothetical protein
VTTRKDRIERKHVLMNSSGGVSDGEELIGFGNGAIILLVFSCYTTHYARRAFFGLRQL